MSKINLPELPPVPEKEPNYDGGDDYWTVTDFERYATAYGEQAVRDALAVVADKCDQLFLIRAATGFPREASTARQLRDEIRALIPENDHGEST